LLLISFAGTGPNRPINKNRSSLANRNSGFHLLILAKLQYLAYEIRVLLAIPHIDLQITNETNSTFQLLTWVGEKRLHGEWRCNLPTALRYEIYDTDQCITHEWWGGYARHNVIRKKVFGPGDKFIADEVVTDNHAVMMYEPLLPQ